MNIKQCTHIKSKKKKRKNQIRLKSTAKTCHTQKSELGLPPFPLGQKSYFVNMKFIKQDILKEENMNINNVHTYKVRKII